jgi:hypothetical protein
LYGKSLSRIWTGATGIETWTISTLTFSRLLCGVQCLLLQWTQKTSGFVWENNVEKCPDLKDFRVLASFEQLEDTSKESVLTTKQNLQIKMNIFYKELSIFCNVELGNGNVTILDIPIQRILDKNYGPQRAPGPCDLLGINAHYICKMIKTRMSTLWSLRIWS